MTKIEVLPLMAVEVTASQDGDVKIPLAFKDATNASVDLSGIAFSLQLSVLPSNQSALAATSYLVLDAAHGCLTLVVPQTVWGAKAVGAYIGDIVATADGKTIVVAVLKISQRRIGGCQITFVSSTPRNAATAKSVGYIPGPQGIPGPSISVNGHTGLTQNISAHDVGAYTQAEVDTAIAGIDDPFLDALIFGS